MDPNQLQQLVQLLQQGTPMFRLIKLLPSKLKCEHVKVVGNRRLHFFPCPCPTHFGFNYSFK